MEQKYFCQECGRELPESEFGFIHHKGGEPTRLPYCKECMNKKRSEGHKKGKARMLAAVEEAEMKARQARLSDFEPVELIEHLANLGYEGNLTYTQVRVIDIKKFKTK